MNRTLKKVLACVMTVIMLVSAAPLGVLAEIDLSAILPDLSVKSQAVNTTYNAVAAAEYATDTHIMIPKEINGLSIPDTGAAIRCPEKICGSSAEPEAKPNTDTEIVI